MGELGDVTKVDLTEIAEGIDDEDVWICYDPEIPGLNRLILEDLKSGDKLLLGSGGSYQIYENGSGDFGDRMLDTIRELVEGK